MANSRWYQFLFSNTPYLRLIHGSISIQQEVKAVKVTQGLTLTAAAFGSAGNSITIAFTAGGTAGAEVVTVTGNAISVQIETGVSTVTQVRTAMQAAAACTALVTTTGTSGSTVATASALPLLTGADGVVSTSIPGVASCSQTGVGEFTITFSDDYASMAFAKFMVLKAAAQDLIPQIKSVNVAAASKTIVVRLLTGATATDPTAAMTLYMKALMRDGSLSY